MGPRRWRPLRDNPRSRTDGPPGRPDFPGEPPGRVGGGACPVRHPGRPGPPVDRGPVFPGIRHRGWSTRGGDDLYGELLGRVRTCDPRVPAEQVDRSRGRLPHMARPRLDRRLAGLLGNHYIRALRRLKGMLDGASD